MSFRERLLAEEAARVGRKTLQEELERRAVRKSFALFVQRAWPIIEPHTELIWNWYTEMICDHLQDVAEDRIKDLIINIPPRHGKSVLVSIMWNAWVWLSRPDSKFIFISYDQSLMDGFSEKVQKIIDSPWYQACIPTLYGPDKNQKWQIGDRRRSLRDFNTTEGGERFSSTVKGAITGHGARFIVVDDPMKASDVQYEGAIEFVNVWWEGTMKSRLDNPKTGHRVIMMQRLHENDLVGHLITKDEAMLVKHKAGQAKHFIGWRKLILPIEYDPEVAERHEVNDPRTEKGELLSPERFPEEVVAELKTMPAYDYSSQYQQDPTPAQGGMFSLSNVTYWYPVEFSKSPPAKWQEPYDEAPKNDQHELPQSGWLKWIQSWDMTFKDTKDSDFVAGQLWAVHKDGKFYLIDQILRRMTFTASKLAVLGTRTMPLWRRATAIYIEDKANGTAIIDDLSKSLPGIIPVNPEGGKIARANAASPYFEAGNVVLPHPFVNEWMKDYLKTFRGFPTVKHDDQVDATTQALIKITKRNDERLYALAYGRKRPG